jgi:hypothetical protein
MAISATLEPRSPILERLSTIVPSETIISCDSSLRIDARVSSTRKYTLSKPSIARMAREELASSRGLTVTASPVISKRCSDLLYLPSVFLNRLLQS